MYEMTEAYRDHHSSTAKDSEVDISLEEKDTLLEAPVMGTPKSSKTTPRSVVFLLLTAILALSNVILGAVVFIQFRNSHKTAGEALRPHQHAHGHEHEKKPPFPLGGLPHVDSHPDWLPPEEWRTEVFRLHQIYGEEPVGTAKEAWLSLIPSKSNSVHLPLVVC